MGILSALLTVGGAIIGGPIGASIGGAIGGAIDQSGASSKASKDQQAAYERAIALRQAAADKITGIQQPYMNLGSGAVNALTGRLNIPAAAPVSASPAATPQGGATSPDGGSGTSFRTMGTNALSGAVMTSGGQPAMADANGFTAGQDQLQLPQPTPVADPSTSAAPVVSPAGTLAQPNGSNAAGVDPGTFGSTANPSEPASYSAPAPFSYTLSDYTPSPAYQWQQDQARKGILASASATGALQSGAALKELQDRAQNIAYQDFTNERAFANGLYNTNTTNALNAYTTNRNAYADDRNYLTNRFDTQTDNLFKATNVGQNASNVVSNADLNVANGNATSATGVGQAQAQNALTQGNIGSNLANGLVGPVSNLLGGASGGAGTPIPLQSQPNLTLQPQTLQNGNALLQPPSIRY